VVIATDHDCIDYQQVADNAKLVFDTRGVMRRLGITGDHIYTRGDGR